VFRSLNFTAITSLGYADVEHRHMSQATSFSQMSQRLALTGGVAFSAFVLHVVGGGGATIPVFAFQMAFLAIAALSVFSVFSFARLHPEAGAEIAGRKQIRSKRFER
jgi:hypothetical protein